MTKRVIALGFFDGVHTGHQALLEEARLQADRLGCKAAALTFDCHPKALITGEQIPLISTAENRIWLMKQRYGMDEVLMLHFDRNLLELPWKDFAEEILINRLQAVHVVCGHDYSFGYLGLGTPQLLREVCAAHGVGCSIIEKVEADGSSISSTRIRALLPKGEIREANRLLGHPYLVRGEVVHGKQLGRTMGIPTANVLLQPELLAPAFGVYSSVVVLEDGSRHAAVTNIGIRPTVREDPQITVEPWILDFSGDLYGQTLCVELYTFLRPERKFASLQELQAAILKNAEETRNLHLQ